MKSIDSIRRRVGKWLLHRPVVDFIICGTQKGGTTALDYYLRQHPQICMATRKEVHFFDNEDYFSTGTPDYSIYHEFFKPVQGQRYVGEATPIYMYWREAPKRMREYNRKLKLIVVLRNPIERAYSQWNMQRSLGIENETFHHAIINEKERCRSALPLQSREYSYIDRGFYSIQLKRLWSYFKKKRVLVLKYEYLKQQPAQAFANICKFIGVKTLPTLKVKDVHSIEYESAMNDEDRKYLKQVFEDEIRQLERLLGWDCSDWLSL